MTGKSARTAAGAALAALLAAGVLSGCASNAGTPTDGGSGAAADNTPGPALTLPAGQTAAATTSTPNGSTKTGSTNGATVAGVPQCQTPDLSPEANIVADSAASGHITMNITLTNNSGHKCTIYGFPGLQLEDKNQDSQPTQVTWDPAVTKTLITLANGQSASSSAQMDKDLPVGSEPLTGPCEPASFYIQITAPNNTTQLVATIGDTDGVGITVCNAGALDVLAFVPGSVGPHE